MGSRKTQNYRAKVKVRGKFSMFAKAVRKSETKAKQGRGEGGLRRLLRAIRHDKRANFESFKDLVEFLETKPELVNAIADRWSIPFNVKANCVNDDNELVFETNHRSDRIKLSSLKSRWSESK